MNKVLTFPGSMLPPEPAVPKEFDAGFKLALDYGRLEVLTPEGLFQFFRKAVDWATEQLGVTLKPDEKFWLTGLLTKCKDVLSAEKALAEIMYEASQVRQNIQRGLMLIEAGNLGLMASGGFVDRRHFDEPRYYADQATAAYGTAATCLNNPFYHQLSMNDRVPLLSSVVRLIRVLCGRKDSFEVYEYVQSVNPTPVMRGFHLDVLK